MINELSWIHVGKWFNACVLAIPAVFFCVFGWWVGQAVTWYPKTWWNPFEKLSPGTMFLQWAALIALVLAANNWFARRVRGPYLPPRPPGGKRDRGEPAAFKGGDV